MERPLLVFHSDPIFRRWFDIMALYLLYLGQARAGKDSFGPLWLAQTFG